MNSIKMVDLESQHAKIRKELDNAISTVLDEGAFINGPDVAEFSRELAEFNKCRHVIPCANGTDALQVSIMALDLKPGSEIITGSFTYVATAEVIAILGYKPVLVDVDPDTFTLCNEQVERAITDNTSAVIPVHLFGQCAEMENLMITCKSNNLHVIEDTAQAIGADYSFSNGISKRAGTIGSFGCTSFFPSKNLGCMGDGGAIFTEDDDLAEKARKIANHGQGEKYIFDLVGINSRLDTLQAAMLRVKLKHLNEYNIARIEAATKYDELLSGNGAILTPRKSPNSSHVYHQYTIKVSQEKRDGLKEHLASKNIPSATYYPRPIHLQEAYAYLGYGDGDFPVSEQLCKSVLSLPMHTELDEEQIEYICNVLNDFF